MNKRLFICGLVGLGLAGGAQAAVVNAVDADWSVNTPVPQGSPVGITVSQTFSGLLNSPNAYLSIADVSVDLNISGGYNGGLYGYLTLQDASGNVATEILLNQIGTSPSNPFGSSGAGMNVTLSDAGTVNGSIHGAPGVPTGLWQPDSANTLDGTFGGLTADGTWTLFLADLDSGAGTSTLNSWGLDVDVLAVPEASETGLMSGVAALLVVGYGALMLRRRKSQGRESV
jgi:hypothetical protein